MGTASYRRRALFSLFIALGTKLALNLTLRPLGTRYLCPDGSSWNSEFRGWEASPETACAFRRRFLSVISETEGTGRLMILDAVFETLRSLFFSVTDRAGRKIIDRKSVV